MNSKPKKKNKIINFRVSETQKDKIMQNAKQLNMSVGEYLIYLEKTESPSLLVPINSLELVEESHRILNGGGTP